MRFAVPAALLVLLASSPAWGRDVSVDPGQWRVVDRDSGPDRYYTQVRDPAMPFLRSHYRPPMHTTVLGWQLPGLLAAAGGRHPCSPTGVLAKGGKTRKKRKPSNAAIVTR